MDPGNPKAKKRGVLVWHRRAGKDKTVFAGFVAPQMFRRVGTYYYIFPTYNQGRKILWDGRDREGFRFLDHIPPEVRDGEVNNTEMKLRVTNGSMLQVIGSDNIDSIVGTNPVGCVFSEYALQDPKGWDYLSPILLENGGWAIFDYTPRGKNHGYRMFRMAEGNPDWYCQLLTVEDTYKLGGTMSPEMVDSERKSGKNENFIRQEYYCFMPNTPILTERGERYIADIKPGDLVFTHTGRLRSVLDTVSHEFTGELVRIKTAGVFDDLVCTSDHRVRVIDPESQTYAWKPAGEVTKGDFLVLPRMKSSLPLISEDMARLIGWFVAEGSFAKTAINFSLNPKNQEEIDEVMGIALRLGFAPRISRSATCTNVIVANTRLIDFLMAECGKGARNKRLPLHLLQGVERVVFDALMKGDGCDIHQGWCFVTVSRTLAMQVQLLAHTLGYRAGVSMSVKKPTEIRGRMIAGGRECFSVQIRREGQAIRLRPAKHGVGAMVMNVSSEPYSGTVHNIKVQYDSSYVAYGRVVHNCDFDAAVDNAVFGDQIYAMRQESRITRVPWEARSEVETYWDIGWDDQTAIWFVQQVGKEVRLIDYYESRLAGPEHYIKVLRERPYTYSRHVLPHDADLSRMETGGKSLKEIMWELGLSVEIGVKLTKEEQIAHARLLFPRVWIDKDKCEAGVGALASWHFAYDDAKQTLGRTPVHDWSSHASDAFCLIGAELRQVEKSKKLVYPSLGLV